MSIEMVVIAFLLGLFLGMLMGIRNSRSPIIT